MEFNCRRCDNLWPHRQAGSGGIDIGPVEVLVLVRPLVRLDEDAGTGQRVRIFSPEETWVPCQLCAFVNPAPDPRHSERGPVPVGHTIYPLMLISSRTPTIVNHMESLS